MFGRKKKPENFAAAFTAAAEELTDKLAAAKCTRCEGPVAEGRAAEGMMVGELALPVVGQVRSVILCGHCGLLMHDLLDPIKTSQPEYQELKARLRAKWAAGE